MPYSEKGLHSVICSCGKVSKRNYLTRSAAAKHAESKYFVQCQLDKHYIRVERM